MEEVLVDFKIDLPSVKGEARKSRNQRTKT